MHCRSRGQAEIVDQSLCRGSRGGQGQVEGIKQGLSAISLQGQEQKYYHVLY